MDRQSTQPLMYEPSLFEVTISCVGLSLEPALPAGVTRVWIRRSATGVVGHYVVKENVTMPFPSPL